MATLRPVSIDLIFSVNLVILPRAMSLPTSRATRSSFLPYCFSSFRMLSARPEPMRSGIMVPTRASTLAARSWAIGMFTSGSGSLPMDLAAPAMS